MQPDLKSQVMWSALIEQIGQLSGEVAQLKGEKAELTKRLDDLIRAHLDRRPQLVKEANGPSD